MTQPESSTAENQALSSTEAEELLDGLPAAPVVPPVPGQPDLPFNTLSPGQSERLCKRLIEQDAEVEHCYLYGKPGEKQFGIDIVARRHNGAPYYTTKGSKCHLSRLNCSSLRKV